MEGQPEVFIVQRDLFPTGCHQSKWQYAGAIFVPMVVPCNCR